MKALESDLSSFIENERWIFAKTYAETWPHEYIVEDNVDNRLFTMLAKHIDTFGHQESFYNQKMIYFYFNGHAYWHMENIINRCLSKDTYEQRIKDGRLPKDQSHAV